MDAVAPPSVVPRSAIDACVECGYPRAGLEAAAVCPECGSPPAAKEWIVIRGWSQPGNPWLGLVGGGIVLLFGAWIVWSVLSRRGMGALPGLAPCAVVPLAGVTMLWAGVRRLRAAPEGGDVTWIVKVDDLEIRRGTRRSVVTLRSFSRCARVRTLTRRWERISMQPRFLTFTTSRRVIWIRSQTIDVEAARKAIAERLPKRPWWRP